MLNSNKRNSVSSIDFNNLRTLVNELIKLKSIKNLDSLDADYSLNWQEDANEMIDDINGYVRQALIALENKDFSQLLFNSVSLRIQVQALGNTLGGITSDLISLHRNDEKFTWPIIPEDYIPPK
ncbi:hypothetical protein [Psychrobacter alimentarius]|uniref:hypothetical protein n=1 Tax=Psychrobacter alimentarius TaxID=261164 RepID=UPI0019187570|nr:hypothetical protein [Psychrobacter alimentarius]